ncbi:MAG: hypothetical protein ABSB79_10335 [Syntrophales bacterium]|jgi:hypothetical protein
MSIGMPLPSISFRIHLLPHCKIPVANLLDFFPLRQHGLVGHFLFDSFLEALFE